MSGPAPAPVVAPLVLPMVSLAREHGFEPARVEGRLPDGLRGTLYRNGPAVFGPAADHWFDGDGAVIALRIADGRAAVAARRVGDPAPASLGRYRHPASLANRVRGLLGGAGFANLANINVLAWQRRLFALYESAPAVELDPDTLERRGPTDFGGVAPKLQAHPHRVASLRTTFQLGLTVGPRSAVEIYAFPDEGAPRRVASVPVPGAGEVHDFFVTERAVVLLLAPLWAGPLDLLRTGSFERALRWRPEQGTEVVVVPLDRPEALVRFPVDPFFWWHQANAWDDGGRIRIEWVRYADFGVSPWLDALHRGNVDHPGDGALWQAVIDPAAGTFRAEPVLDVGVEFPWVADAVVGRRHRYTWMAAQSPAAGRRGWFDRLVRRDGETGEVTWIDPGPGRAVGEPIVVSRGEGELDGWVLAMVREREGAHLAVWDARRPEDGPLARVHLAGPVPHTLHGTWVPAR